MRACGDILLLLKVPANNVIIPQATERGSIPSSTEISLWAFARCQQVGGAIGRSIIVRPAIHLTLQDMMPNILPKRSA
jgi:hypothetical protein